MTRSVVTTVRRMVEAEPHETIPALVDDLAAAGVRRLHVLAWRDLDDPDAGGSELHADECMRRWAAAGLDIVHRTSAAIGQPPAARRNGYAGRSPGESLRRVPAHGGGRGAPPHGPVRRARWRSGTACRGCRRCGTAGPRITIVHHVHGPMWDQSLPWPLAPLGRVVEARVAPALYRRGAVVTPSQSTREELLELGFRPGRVTAVDNGVDDFFRPSADRRADEADEPLVIAVGRLAPVKRFGLALEVAAAARRRVPGLRLRVVGDGPRPPRAGGLDRRAWGGRLGDARRPRGARGAPRRVPPGVGGAQRLAGGGLGSHAHRGGRLRHAGRGDRHPRAPLVGRRRRDRAARRAGPAGGRTGAGAVRRRPPSPPRHGRRRRAATLTWEATATGVLRVLRDEVVGAQR